MDASRRGDAASIQRPSNGSAPKVRLAASPSRKSVVPPCLAALANGPSELLLVQSLERSARAEVNLRLKHLRWLRQQHGHMLRH